MEKRVKRGVDELKKEKLKEFFRECGWWVGKIHSKAGATLKDDKGRVVHFFGFTDAYDLMCMLKELFTDEEKLNKLKELL
jgi:hypothetical protein